LRDRRDEILPLATRFAGAVTISPAAAALLSAYDWPGNVRELRNAIERALAVGDGRIEPHDLPDSVASARVETPASSTDIRQHVATVERQAVIDALAAANGSQTKAARTLGISRFALMRLMDKHDLKRR
jgi:DNA-binding NtrC family response regulator